MDVDTACARGLPSLSIPGSPDTSYVHSGSMRRSPNASTPTKPASLQVSPELQRYTSTQLPNLHIRHGIQRHPTYINKTIAYGAPNIIKKIYTGQLPATYFNDICYGQQAHPRGEFLYSARMERQHELSEPKHLSREQARHVVRDIQDARFRKARQLEQQSALKKKERTRRAEVARLRVAEGVPRGKLAYLTKLERHKEKLDLKIQATKETRRKTLAFIKPLGIDRNRQE